MTKHRIVLYAVGSPVVVDVEESLSRARVRVVAAIRNVPGQHWSLSAERVIDRAELTPALCRRAFLVPLFGPGNRQIATREASESGFDEAFTLVDPTSITPSAFTPGRGTYVNAGCTIGAAGRFGDFVFINRGACIGHHADFGAFVSVGPGAVLGGQVTVGKGSLIGAGAVVLPGIQIGANAVIGAGAVVTKDVPSHTLAVGNPARVVKTGIAGYRDLTVA